LAPLFTLTDPEVEIAPLGSVSVNSGANQSFTISPNSGYQIASVSVDSASVGAMKAYSFSNVTANHTISATFSPVATTCTSFTYSSWDTCQSDGTQTRTVTASSPSGCTGGSPVLTQSCTYVIPTCTSFTYSAWGTCTNGTQARTVTASTPSGCAGGSPVLTQSCSSSNACTSFTYSAWSTCTNGAQTRIVSTSSPSGCTGGSPLLTQSCNFSKRHHK